MMPRWALDLIKHIDSVPFGTVVIPKITRVGGKTVEIETHAKETLKPESVKQAIEDLTKYLQTAEQIEYDGEVSFSVVLKKGKIKSIGFHNVKRTNY